VYDTVAGGYGQVNWYSW